MKQDEANIYMRVLSSVMCFLVLPTLLPYTLRHNNRSQLPAVIFVIN